MAEFASAIIGIAGVAVQLTQVVVALGLDWKEAPKEIKAFHAEIESLESISRDIWKYLIDNPDFRESVGEDNSSLLQAFQDEDGRPASTKQIIDHCKNELEALLEEITKRATGGLKGWGRLKSAFLLKRTGEAVQMLDRRYEHLNRLIQIDSANLGSRMYKELKEVSQNQRAQQQQNMDHKVLDWLSASRFGLQVRDLLDRREEGTGEWLAQTPTFQTWQGSDKPQILLCQGMPGAGKTMLAASGIEYIESKNEGEFDVGIAYFFCNFQRQQEQSLSQILSSLLRQLVQRQGIIPESVRELYEKYGERQTRPLRREITRALQQVIGDFRKVYIIIDALDEYQPPDGQRDDLLWEIAKIHREAGANIFLTSRMIPAIKAAFENSLSMEIRAHNDDILAYTESHIQSSRLARFPKLHSKIQDSILKAAGGMFLLVELHMRTLQSQFTVGDIEDTLESLPHGQSGLDDTYAQAMQRIENQRDTEILAKRVLSWLTLARRPLSCPEFLHAISTKSGTSNLDRRYIPDIQDLLSVCAGLVTLDERSNIVRLVHYTVQEYFERTQAHWLPEGPRQIESVCLTYLSLHTFKTGSCSTDEEFEARIREYPLYIYACRNWGYHLIFPLPSDTWTLLEGVVGDGDKVSACAQALLARPASSGYIQNVPVQAGAVHVATYFGSEELVRAMLERGHSANQKDSFGQTPLMWGAIYGHLSTVLLLLEGDTGIDVNEVDSSGRTALHHATRNSHVPIVHALLKHGADISVQDENGYTPLYIAADMGSHDILELLLYGLGSDTEGHEHICSEKRGLVEHLITHGVGQTLREAIERDDESRVRLLLEKGVNVSFRLYDHETCLTLAASKRGERVLDALLEWGADPQIGTWFGGTALHATVVHSIHRPPARSDASASFSRIVRLLLESGVNINDVTHEGQTVFYRAVRWDDEVAIRCLATIPELDPNLGDTQGQTPLLVAAAQGDEETVRFIIGKYGFDPDTRDNRGRTALICAADSSVWDDTHRCSGYGDPQKRQAIVDLLLETPGADINAQDLQGRTALMCASASYEDPAGWAGSSTSLVEILLLHDAAVDIRDSTGKTALAYAAKEGIEHAVDLLIRNGAQVEVEHLEEAAARSNTKILQRLLENAEEHMKSDKWLATTQLYEAVGSGNLAQVKALVELGADMRIIPIWEILNGDCVEILHYVSAQGIDIQGMKRYLDQYWFRGFKDLVKAFFDITGPIQFESAREAKVFLHNTTHGENQDFVRLLFDNGYDLKFVEQCDDGDSFPLLHMAVLGTSNENGGMVNLLLDQGVNIDTRNRRGETALHQVGGSLTLTRLLVSRGANLEARCHWGKTPLAVAAERGLEETAKLLLELGADPYSVDLESLAPNYLGVRDGFVKSVRMIQSARYIAGGGKQEMFS